jgi:hypothetical protein
MQSERERESIKHFNQCSCSISNTKWNHAVRLTTAATAAALPRGTTATATATAVAAESTLLLLLTCTSAKRNLQGNA